MSRYIKFSGTIETPDDMTMDELVDFMTDAIEERKCYWMTFWEDVTEEYRKRNGEVEDGT